MRSAYPLLVPICSVLLLLPAGAAGSNPGSHSKFTGVYVSRNQKGVRSGPFMNLSLGPDGSATVTEDTGNVTKTLFGHWVDAGARVTVTFDAQQGQPAEAAMAFEPAHDGLQAVVWDRATWGKDNPPPMRKGGAKIKEHYWLTTNP